MIAADSSSLIAYFGASDYTDDTAEIDTALADHSLVLPPVVVTELCSSPQMLPEVAQMLTQLPLLEPLSGYWERAGELRKAIRKQGYKAAIADVLIAQICIDHHVPLITRDRDFRHCATIGGLQLIM
ncbi:MAG: PIN domain-containing protein [Chloroflexota bacterium]